MVDRLEIEETLKLISGVLSARVIGDDGNLEEVHILASSARHPKQIARDVESCLIARFGLAIDHRRISVAQVESDLAKEARLSLEAVTIRLAGGVASAEVVLRLDQTLFTGKAEGPASARQRLILAARAAACGVKQAVGGRVDIVVEDVGRFEVGRMPVIACVVTLADGRTEEVLAGSARVRRDEGEAAARAVLSALNRRLGLVLEEARAPV